MANNRLEELRRRAQERIQQVRESMERGEDVAQSAPPMEAPPPPPAERRRESTTRDAYQVGPQSLEGPSLEGRSLEVPGYETQRTQLEATLMETLRPTSFSEGPQRRPVAPIATQRGRRSRAATRTRCGRPCSPSRSSGSRSPSGRHRGLGSCKSSASRLPSLHHNVGPASVCAPDPCLPRSRRIFSPSTAAHGWETKNPLRRQ